MERGILSSPVSEHPVMAGRFFITQ
jgi:uncharacterized protein (DUF362 family)